MWETDLNAILIEPEAQHGTVWAAWGFQLLLVCMLGFLLLFFLVLAIHQHMLP